MFLTLKLSIKLNSDKFSILDTISGCVINSYIEVIDIFISRWENHKMGLQTFTDNLLHDRYSDIFFKSPFNLAHISSRSLPVMKNWIASK